MNNVPKKQKDSVLKTLAIVGFIGIIVLLAWLAIQFVQVMPSAFSSLASIVEGVGQYRQADTATSTEDEPASFTVTSDSTMVDTGTQAEISWDTADAPGSYTFSYECVDGVAIDLRDEDGLRSIACDTNYNVGDTDSLSLQIDSEKQRYEDIRYTVSYFGTNDTTPRATGSAVITVVNTDIVDTFANETPATTTPETTVAEDTSVETEDRTPTTTDTGSTETDAVASADPESTTDTSPSPAPQFEQEYIYAIPTNDPNGRVDLGVRFIAIGSIEDGAFFPTHLTSAETDAIQIAVKNYGTKTSEAWEFSLAMPNGSTYESAEMEPLKPNERAILSVAFSAADAASHTFQADVDTVGDRNALNDRFVETVSLD